MTNKIVASFAVGVGMLAFAAVSQGQNMPSSPGKMDAPMETKANAAKKASGEVTSVDAKTGKLAVKTSTDELNLDVQGSAAKKNLANIKVGDRVNVSYQDKNGTLVANSVSKAAARTKDNMGSSSSNMGSSTKK
ncbi:MAG TPA: hypothetical protein VMT22_22200 [Terriglobales bacterium]|nr:hypothetical protein [Terriglobales bacterium]